MTSTSAVITGAVNPDGVPAGYAFELGVYNGTSTQYTIVYSAEAGSGNTPVEESLPVTGLQPGTTYAYRIDGVQRLHRQRSPRPAGRPGHVHDRGNTIRAGFPVTPSLLPVPVVAFPSRSGEREARPSQRR